MQIFQWLLKVTTTHDDDDQARQSNTNSIHTNRITTNGSNNKSRDIVLYKNRGVINRRSSLRGSAEKDRDLGQRKNFNLFKLLCRKDVAKACFYSTLHLRRLRSVKTREFRNHSNSMKMKKEDMVIRGLSTNHKTDHSGTNHVGNKVLPISDVTVSSSNNEQCAAGMTERRDNIKIKGDNKTKTISRMKELLRWAAAAKSEKGAKFMGRKVLHFRNRGSLKSVQDDDQLSTESPKISFRWDVESCSTISSTYSGTSMASSLKNIDDQITSCNMLSLKSTPTHDKRRKGNWITTDSEFVVLEL